jgi:hypothetical protein
MATDEELTAATAPLGDDPMAFHPVEAIVHTKLLKSLGRCHFAILLAEEMPLNASTTSIASASSCRSMS